MKGLRKRFSSTLLIWIYLLVSVVGILIISQIFNGLISTHDNALTNDIDSLVAEKMNRSIDYMIESVDEMATVLSYQDLLELDQLYGQLTDSIPESAYISIGIIAKDGSVYGLPSEAEEMEKWNFIQLAEKTEKVSISEPYRSSMTGKLVFTMFSPIFQQGERLGCIFVTYPLSELQNMANSTVLQDDVEIYLMNAKSDNIILCSGSDVYKIGNWSSMLLLKQDIAPDSLEDYNRWEDSMKAGVYTDSVQFSMNGVDYTQVYEAIDAMDGWSVVVRIPNSALSDTLQAFQKATLIFVAVLVLVFVIILIMLRRLDAREKAEFEYMSNHDALTDVYNRNAFDRVVQKYLDNEGKAEHGALVFVDIDYFKQINDKYGHDIGDKALIAFANCLRELFGEDSIIARYGGDEFVLLVKHIDSREGLNKRLEKLRDNLLKAQVLEKYDKNFKLQYSAGISMFPDQGIMFADLVKFADLALYEVKARGRNDYQWYEG